MAEVLLQFSCENHLTSKTIAWFSQGYFSHVDALVEPTGKLLGARNDSVGGEPPGVRYRPYDYVNFSRKVVLAVPCTQMQYDAYWEFLQQQLGKPYDQKAIWGFVFDRDWRAPDSWICSELQTRAGEVAKILPRLYLATNKITPVASALVYSAVGAKVCSALSRP